MKLGAVVRINPPRKALDNKRAHDILWAAVRVRIAEDRQASGVACYVVRVHLEGKQ